jgi:hypothetical protein
MDYGKRETTDLTHYAPPFSILASIKAPMIRAFSFVEIAFYSSMLMIVSSLPKPMKS